MISEPGGNVTVSGPGLADGTGWQLSKVFGSDFAIWQTSSFTPCEVQCLHRNWCNTF